MASDLNGANNILNLAGNINGLNSGSANPASSQTKKNNEIGQDEFLKMLVAQLKNQDPMDPMKGEEFAVNLAQFSSLEQLIGINNKLGQQSDPATNLSSMASYLGQEVAFNNAAVDVQNGDGGMLRINLPLPVSQLNINFLNNDGSTAGTATLSDLPAGKQTVRINSLGIADGKYQVKANGVGRAGESIAADVWAAGIVTGIIPGADPKLIVGGQEISPSEITEINLPHVAQ